MLDVLTAVTPYTPPEWVQQCRESVRVAALQAEYSVRAVEVPWVPGHVGQAMLNAFDCSLAPYVAWVDDDDYVLPSAFSCLAPHFEAMPKAICTYEIQQGARGQQLLVPRRHHLTAFRRDVIEGWRSAIAGCVAGLTSTQEAQDLLMNGTEPEVIVVPEYAYVWRRYLSGGMALRNQAKQAAS